MSQAREHLEPSMRRATSAPPIRRYAWNPWLRGAVSLAILYHLTAVVVAPLSIPPSMHTDYVRPLVAPYMAVAFLDHGYKFFAPDPGPSHLVRYELEFADGRREEGLFPDRDKHWPRLFYHRHFMLSEFLNAGPPGPNFDPALEWDKQPPSPWQEAFAKGYAAHLLAESGAQRVSLYLRRHLIPSPMDLLEGKRLDDPEWYREVLLGSFDAESLRADKGARAMDSALPPPELIEVTSSTTRGVVQ